MWIQVEIKGSGCMRGGSNSGNPQGMWQIELHNLIGFHVLSDTTIHSMHLTAQACYL